MLNTFTFNNVDGAHSFEFNADTSPLNKFDVTVDPRVSTDRERMQRHGINPTKPFRGGMQIHIEGVMFQDTTALYTQYRKSMILALFGDPNAAVDLTNRKLGTLVINLDGETEDWQTDCVVPAYTNPIKGDFPTLSEFAVTFFSWTPYFTGSTSGNFYYWS